MRLHLRSVRLNAANNHVVRWALALGAVEGDQDALKYIDDDRRNNILQHIAVVSLNKTPGGSVSCNDEALRITEKNADLIKSQIFECNPDTIICCGASVSDDLERVLNGANLHWKEAVGHRYGRYDDIFVLDFLHPASRKNENEMVEEIIELYGAAEREIF